LANRYLAYEALSVTMCQLLDGLTAVSTSAKADVSKTREGMAQGAQLHDFAAEHPVVRTPPGTGRKSFYVNVAHTAHFKGMSEA
jgi:taurine dioxygenase